MAKVDHKTIAEMKVQAANSGLSAPFTREQILSLWMKAAGGRKLCKVQRAEGRNYRGSLRQPLPVCWHRTHQRVTEVATGQHTFQQCLFAGHRAGCQDWRCVHRVRALRGTPRQAAVRGRQPGEATSSGVAWSLMVPAGLRSSPRAQYP
jgi:hypothetical protein